MTTGLYLNSAGRGPELLLLHGWALHGGVWDTLLPRLSLHFRVTRVDLPGHGLSRAVALSADLCEVSRQLLQDSPDGAIWLGWSLGGLLAMRAALDAPEKLRALVLVDTTPRFVAGAGWPHAMPAERLAEFAAGLEHDYRGTLQRFLSLQVRGDDAARQTLRQLRESLSIGGKPSATDLAMGLAILRDSDLRAELDHIKVPTLVLAGSHDRLTPPEASEFLAANIPAARLQLIQRAAHAPFLSHGDEFADALLAFSHSLHDASLATAGVRG